MRRPCLLVVPLFLGSLALLLVSVLASPSPPDPGGLVARFTTPLGADPAAAAIRRRTITPEFASPLEVRANGHQVVASGPQACDPGERWEVEVVITQGDVVGEGHDSGHCSGDVGSWTTKVPAGGRTAFTPGSADGCATMVTRHGNRVTDSFNWCQGLVLEAS